MQREERPVYSGSMTAAAPPAGPAPGMPGGLPADRFSPKRVALISPSPLVRPLLRALDETGQLCVVGSAATLQAAPRLAGTCQPEVLLLHLERADAPTCNAVSLVDRPVDI
jgi:hypothetical protein